MEIIMPDNCVKCGNDLSEEEKRIGLPLCQICINSLLNVVKNRLQKAESRNYENNVDNFSRFILSSGELFKLEDMEIIQSSFNIFMSRITDFAQSDPAIASKVLVDSIKFLKKELNNIDNLIGNDKKSYRHAPNERFISSIDELIKKEKDKEKDNNNREK